MRATIMYKAGDVRIENVPDATITEPTDEYPAVRSRCYEHLLHFREFAAHDLHRNVQGQQQLPNGVPEISFDRGPQLTRGEGDSQQ
jgi:hypothetical protein